MKKKLVLLPVIVASLAALTACPAKPTKESITFGTYISQTATELRLDQLLNKLEGSEQGENFMLAIYPDNSDGSPKCSCWTNFSKILDQYVVKFNTVIYKMCRNQVSSSKKEKMEDYGFTISNLNQPYFYLIKNGKVIKEYVYNTKNELFSKYSALKSVVDTYFTEPNLYWVDEDILYSDVFGEKVDTVVHYMWSFCPDCQYCSPNCLWPLAHNNSFSKQKMYVIDIGELTGYNPKGLTIEEQFKNFDTSNTDYVNFLEEFELSEAGNDVLGYGRGFVPTTQYWSNGELKDASVYFNDTVEKVNDKYVVTDSYYSQERSSKLSYLDGVETKVLKGLELTEDDVTVSETSVSWNKDSASKYHNKLLEAFIKKYCIGNESN